MLLQVFRASTEYSTNSYCTTDLCTDCKDSEKVVQHIESNSACFLSSGSASEPVQNSLEKHCLVGRIGKRRGKRVDRSGTQVFCSSWPILAIVLLWLSLSFLIGLWFVFLFLIHFVNNYNMPGIVIDTGETAMNKGPASVELTFWLDYLSY